MHSLEFDILVWLLGIIVCAVGFGGIILPYLLAIGWTLSWIYICYYDL